MNYDEEEMSAVSEDSLDDREGMNNAIMIMHVKCKKEQRAIWAKILNLSRRTGLNCILLPIFN